MLHSRAQGILDRDDANDAFDESIEQIELLNFGDDLAILDLQLERCFAMGTKHLHLIHRGCVKKFFSRDWLNAQWRNELRWLPAMSVLVSTGSRRRRGQRLIVPISANSKLLRGPSS